MGQRKNDKGLTEKEERFCILFCTDYFDNGTQSYAEAFNIDLTQEGKYNICSVSASNLLRKPKVIERIDELLEEQGFSDKVVEKHHLYNIKQKADLRTSQSAIDSYYKLKRRFENKDDNQIQKIEIEVITNDKKGIKKARDTKGGNK